VSAAVSDSVELTGTAQLLASFQTDLSSIDTVDMAKVDAIRQAIAQGTYQIDPQKIADSLLSLEGELA
jgi:negative regulator of flagellin synthesis FlgM